MRNLLLATAAVGALALAAPAAHATLIINASGGAVVNLVNTPLNAGAATNVVLANGVNVSVLSASGNSPGGATAELFGSTTQITNNTGATQSVTLALIMSGFTSPIVPPIAVLMNNLSGTWTANLGTSTISAVGCVDPSNSAGTSQLTCPGGSISAPALPGNVTGFNGSFNSPTASALVTNPLSLYAIDEIVTISIANGGNFNLTTSESLSSVPEPASLALFGVGLLGLGFVANRKRSV